jgi:hypothetical protein
MDVPEDILEITAYVYGLLQLPGLGLPHHQHWSAQRGPGTQNICKVLTLPEVGEEKREKCIIGPASLKTKTSVTAVQCLTPSTSGPVTKKKVQQYSLLNQNLLKRVTVKAVTLLR